MVLAVACLVAPGCTSQKGADAAKEKDKTQPQVKEKGKDAKKDEKGHEHGETGPHGGPLADWDDTYHAEFTVPEDKKVVVYILDDKAVKAPKVPADKIKDIKINLKAPTRAEDIELKYDEKLSGEKGIAFTATNDAFAKKDAEYEGVIRGTVDGKEYREKFKGKAGK
jgi:hypothetical protein